MFRKLWNDESGSIVSTELVLVGSLLVVGAISGLGVVRNAVDSEISDFASALNNFDQSYSVSGLSAPGAFTAGSYYLNGKNNKQQVDFAPATQCMVVLNDGSLKIANDKNAVMANNSQPQSQSNTTFQNWFSREQESNVMVDRPNYSEIED